MHFLPLLSYHLLALTSVLVLLVIRYAIGKSRIAPAGQRVLRGLIVVLCLCIIAFLLFLDAIALGVLAPVPN